MCCCFVFRLSREQKKMQKEEEKKKKEMKKKEEIRTKNRQKGLKTFKVNIWFLIPPLTLPPTLLPFSPTLPSSFCLILNSLPPSLPPFLPPFLPPSLPPSHRNTNLPMMSSPCLLLRSLKTTLRPRSSWPSQREKCALYCSSATQNSPMNTT